ncbi:MAG TPA: tetratricopeptide repeat protein [Candidatus Tectomicrobia bacterium]
MSTPTSAVGMERKLAAIFSTDVAGYSRLMGDDEEATIRTLTASREVISTLIQHHRGRVVDAPGDNLLAEFASVVDAVRCAVEIQHALTEKNAELSPQRQMQFRIGINLGDVIVEGERLYGDGVNIAARLESLAEPGGICISGTVYDQVKNKVALDYEYLGEREVKNIAEPVRVYRVQDDLSVETPRRGVSTSPTPGKVSVGYRQRALVAVAGALLIAGTIVATRVLFLPTPNPQSPTPSTQSLPLPLPDKPSLIVLPFVNMSKDPDQDYFSDGLTEVLTGDLSKISSLFIIARNTAFTYKGKAANIQDVGREMGVRYVLEGSVQKADQQIRITTQLIDATTGYHLWSEQYDRPLKDIFALQDEIVQKIVTTLKLQLTLQEQGIIVRKHTDNLEAYDYFLRGVEAFNRFTKESNTQARQLYEKAVALDPQYAEAEANLGWTYYMEWTWRWSADPQNPERMLALAHQALALDDSLPVAHSLLSWGYYLQQQYDQAIAEGERAIALDPNNADSYARQADVLNLAGRPADALQMVEQAMRLNPRYPPLYLLELGWTYRMTGRYAEAIATLKEVISRMPTHLGARFNLAFSYCLQWVSQQSPDAQTLEPVVAAAQRGIALNDSLHWNHWILGSIYLYQQQYDQALAEMERGVALGPNEAESYAFLAEVLSCMGRTENALEAAAQALRLKPAAVDIHLSGVGSAYAVAGRYEEARAPLQRYLSRYPNILPVHLMLAAVYSELGKTSEARAEAAEVLRLNPKFSLAVHRERMPIKDPAVLERHLAALRKAGLK